MVIDYANRSLRQSQCRYCTTRRDMLAVVTMCTHFLSYLRGAQFTLRTDQWSLQWLQKFCNSDGMLARWYMLLGQFSVKLEYQPWSQHANADGLSRQCGQCLRPDCLVTPPDVAIVESGSTSELADQPFAELAMGDCMDSDWLPELSGETWVAVTHLDEVTGPDLIASSLMVRLRPGRTVPVCLRNCVRDISSSAIFQSIWTGACGVAVHPRRWRYNW